MSKKLFVGGLSWGTTDEGLHGAVLEVWRDRRGEGHYGPRNGPVPRIRVRDLRE